MNGATRCVRWYPGVYIHAYRHPLTIVPWCCGYLESTPCKAGLRLWRSEATEELSFLSAFNIGDYDAAPCVKEN